jgi:hypothetical protein
MSMSDRMYDEVKKRILGGDSAPAEREELEHQKQTIELQQATIALQKQTIELQARTIAALERVHEQGMTSC